jgi:signal recognition particle subunit SRP54
MLGQESVNVAKNFNDAVAITGIILTKMDGDARGGAALSMKYTAGVPIKFMGTGEKTDRLEPFYPERIASRILGMGDVVSLVEKVQQSVTAEDAKKAEEKFRKANFNLEDFLEQLRQMRKLGPMEEILKMIPGASCLSNLNIDEKEMSHIEAIILSMTRRERNHPEIIDASRRARIAKGSGVKPERISRLLKQFAQAKKMMKSMGKRRHNIPNFGGGFPGGMGF